VLDPEGATMDTMDRYSVSASGAIKRLELTLPGTHAAINAEVQTLFELAFASILEQQLETMLDDLRLHNQESTT
jgi:hypothetical protein